MTCVRLCLYVELDRFAFRRAVRSLRQHVTEPRYPACLFRAPFSVGISFLGLTQGGYIPRWPLFPGRHSSAGRFFIGHILCWHICCLPSLGWHIFMWAYFAWASLPVGLFTGLLLLCCSIQCRHHPWAYVLCLFFWWLILCRPHIVLIYVLGHLYLRT